MFSTWTIVFGALLAMYLIVGGILYLRSDLTIQNILTIGIALLALTSGVLIAAEYHTTQTEIEQVDYRVESQVEGCDTAEPHQVSEFNELSPDAQEVFLLTLQSNEGYTTTENPDQFRVSASNDLDNYIIYESNCYSLVGYNGGTTGAGIYLYVLLLIGIPFTLVLAALTVISYQYQPSES